MCYYQIWIGVLVSCPLSFSTSGNAVVCRMTSCTLFFQFRLVVKTALKLLLVFVEYTESNAPLLIQAVSTVDEKRGE